MPLLLPSESKICHVNIDFSLNSVKETRLKNAIFCRFKLMLNVEPDWLSCLGYLKTLAIHHVKYRGRFLSLFDLTTDAASLSQESPVTRPSPISRGKRVIYHVACSRI